MHQWVLGSVTKNQLSMTVLLTPALVRRELQQPVHSRFHRAREREMLYRLGVTGCGSRVALSEMCVCTPILWLILSHDQMIKTFVT